jgi:hypothetical protein
MAKTIEVKAVSGTQNIFKFVLWQDSAPLVDHTIVTAAKLRSDAQVTYADSADFPAAWDFTQAGYISVKLGLTDIPAGTHNCVLIVKSAANPTGLAWDTTIQINLLG